MHDRIIGLYEENAAAIDRQRARDLSPATPPPARLWCSQAAGDAGRPSANGKASRSTTAASTRRNIARGSRRTDSRSSTTGSPTPNAAKRPSGWRGGSARQRI